MARIETKLRMLVGSSSPLLSPIVLALFLILLPGRSLAERLSFRAYGATEGLESLGGTCLSQAGPGYLLVCSEHGVYSYDGRTFQNLGARQGLVDGGVVYDIRVTTGGMIAVRFPDRLFVSDTPLTLARPPAALTFRVVDLRDAPLFNEHPKQLAPIEGGFALIVGRQLMRVDLAAPGQQPVLAPMNYSAAERSTLAGPAAVFSVDGKLWETFDDGRACQADPGAVRCFGPSQGLSGGPWDDLVEGGKGAVLARSSKLVATIDPHSGAISDETLPDQGGQYGSYPFLLGLFRTPAGALITQSAHGLIVRQPSGWVRLDRRDGTPAGMICAVLDDHGGQLWIQVFGRGLFRGLGYGHWESLQQDDGLSEGAAWQAVRTEGGSLWVATDTGVDEVSAAGGALRVVGGVPGPSYALAVAPDGRLWATDANAGLQVIDPSTKAVTRVKLPALGGIAFGPDRRAWLGTEHGLFRIDDRTPLVPVRDVTSDRVVAVSSDGSGGVWFLSGGHLWHRRADGNCVAVSGAWPAGEFEPFAIATSRSGHVWIGGAGGLYDLTILRDHAVAMVAVRQSALRTNTVVAVTVDRRGWVWAGTARGISAFDGHRWVSADATSGLVWDDVSQSGIYDDPDGSIWVTTSQGLSHLLDPAWLFSDHPVRVAVSQAMLGGTALKAERLPYSTEPLSLQFGAFSFASERSVVFRYRMSGVDAGWAESTTGAVRYPSVPPGRHVLTVVGYDVLSDTASQPVTLTIQMDFPWWESWWADLLYVVAGLGAFAAILKTRERAVLRVRERATIRKQRELEILVEERTRDMRIAQAALQRQATMDGLTGLLNRAEVERRLAERLAAAQAAGEMLVAMVDIDHFKRINDSHGHLVGDDVIRAIGVRVAALLRDKEYAGRYGGEEILIILDDLDGRGAERVLTFHQLIRQASFHARGLSIPVTCSIGIAWVGPGDDWEALVGRADAALYEAKHSGRDKVVESGNEQVPDLPAWLRPEPRSP